jgi:hypothetical protein
MDPKLKFYMLSKEDFASVGFFYKLEYLSCLAVVLPKFMKKLVHLVVPCARFN